jgi:outer membrane protein assembly factor BamB
MTLRPVAAFVGVVLAGAADWPQFRGPAGTGASTETGLPVTWSATENLVWKTDLPGPGTSSPVVVGDRIYLTCYSGYNLPGKPGGNSSALRRHLLALDRRTGKLLRDTPVAARLPEQEAIRDGHGYASSTPAADAERVYCFFGKSGVYAYDHAGKQLWQADVGETLHNWGSAASPVVHGDLVYVNASVESETLFAFDRTTGKERWKAKRIIEAWNTPVLVTPKDGKSELVVAVPGKVLGFDPATGAALWSCATDITYYMVPSLVAHDGVVYCLGGRSGVAALAVRAGGKGDVTKTHRLWTGRKGSNVSSPVVHDGHLYWMNDVSGTVYCAKAETGEVVFEEQVARAGQVYASALLADGRVYFMSRTGRAVVVAAKPTYQLLATNDLRDGSLFHATPVAADGRLLVRSDKALYCLKK